MAKAKACAATKKDEHPEIAVTLYNLRNYCKTEEDFAKTLGLLCEIGYRTVQISGVALEPKVIKKHLDAAGLQCCATHESPDDILHKTKDVIKKLEILECPYTAIGSAPIVYSSQLGMKELGAQMTKAGKEMSKNGIHLGYHNHDFEFNRMGGETTLLETLFNNSDPEYVFSELDVHWVARGGASPVSWIRKLAGRIDVIHFKDFTITSTGDDVRSRTPTICEIGYGNLDWPEIIKACRDINVRTFSIEQDSPFPGRHIFDSMKMSFDFCKKMGLRP